METAIEFPPITRFVDEMFLDDLRGFALTDAHRYFNIDTPLHPLSSSGIYERMDDLALRIYREDSPYSHLYWMAHGSLTLARATTFGRELSSVRNTAIHATTLYINLHRWMERFMFWNTIEHERMRLSIPSESTFQEDRLGYVYVGMLYEFLVVATGNHPLAQKIVAYHVRTHEGVYKQAHEEGFFTNTVRGFTQTVLPF